MANLQALTPPSWGPKKVYNYTEEDASAAWEMLEAGDTPGEAGFENANKARNAAQALIAVMHTVADASNIGTRVWGTEEDGNTPANFAYVLKIGKRATPTASGNDAAEPDDAGAGDAPE